MRRYLASILLILGNFTFSAVAAQTVPHQATSPAEVMLLEPRGFAVLGHGTMDGNVLRLEVLYEVGNFVLLLIGPAGTLERFVGSQGADGELRLDRVDEQDAQLLEQFFGARDIELVVVRRSRLDEGAGATDVPDVDDSDEDDRQLAALLREQLTLAGHQPVIAGTLKEARLALVENRFDLILLDLNLPDGDGLDLAQEVSEDHDTPMLMLTARADVDSRVAGLYAGASDYLTKPFSVMELLARVHVRLLVQYRGRVFTKNDLERAVYGSDPPDSNTIEVYVYNLRRKLKGLGLEGVIRTVRNRGCLVV